MDSMDTLLPSNSRSNIINNTSELSLDQEKSSWDISKIDPSTSTDIVLFSEFKGNDESFDHKNSNSVLPTPGARNSHFLVDLNTIPTESPTKQGTLVVEDAVCIDATSDECNLNSDYSDKEEQLDAELVDVKDAFLTDQVFNSRKSLVHWCQIQGRKIQTIVVTSKSDNGIKRKPRLILICERGGRYRNRKDASKSVENRDTATRKCNCPFELRGIHIDGDKWKVEVTCGFHNHKLPNTLVGHPYCGRLNAEEQRLVIDMTVAGAKPRSILAAIKRRNDNNASTMKTIYNAKASLRTREMEGRTAVQQLMKLLVEKHYVYWHRKDDATNEISELFWAHPEGILLAKCFPSVVLVDCTYKTNRYKMPLFAMVGVTSTSQTFSIAHCFLHNEKEDNYRWALSKLKLLFAPDNIPKVFVTDREYAVINAIGGIFPEASRMLCSVHIERNVQQHCKPQCTTDEEWKSLIGDWTKVMVSKSEEDFKKNWDDFKKEWEKLPKCIEYLRNTWFPHRERFVLGWTNQIKHFGNGTTNRAEGSHSKLKMHLESGQGTFQTIFEQMDNMLSLQINEVKADFEYSLGAVKHKHNGPLFDYIRGNLSHYSLDLIKKERDKSCDIGFEAERCDHVLRTVYGLPCAHELARYSRENNYIPIKDIDDRWAKLTILPNETTDLDVDHRAEMIMFKKLYMKSTEDEKNVLMRKLKEIATPTTTSLKEPKPVVPKGRPLGSKRKLTQKEIKHEKSTKRDPSGFEYAMTLEEKKLKTKVPEKLSQTSKSKKVQQKKVDMQKNELIRFLPYIWDSMQPFIADFKNVRSDGNCGFRCIAEHFGWNDSGGWIQVRADLLGDLEKHKNKYCHYFGNWFYEDNKKILQCFDSPCSKDYWMQMPDMGYLIASAYNCVVVHLSAKLNLTFVPHDEPMSDEKIHEVIPIAFVEGNHFVRVILTNDAPIPPLASMWERLVTGEAAIWRDVYSHEIDKYISLLPKTYDDLDFPITIT